MKRRIKVTYNGSRFVARVQEHHPNAPRTVLDNWPNDDGEWRTIRHGSWEQYRAEFTARSPVKAYRKAEEFLRREEKLDREDEVRDAFIDGASYVRESVS